MKKTLLLLLAFYATNLLAQENQPLWPKGKMPDVQQHQIAAMTDVSGAPGFKPEKHRMPFLEWFEKPMNPNGGCMIMISGGGYYTTCDMEYIKIWRERFTALGFQCVSVVYRTPRPIDMAIYQSAWEDGQRAVRLVRSQAEKRGFNPERIGAIGMSAGSHLAVLLGTSALTSAYQPVDKLDSIPCHLNWVIANAPAYVTTDSEAGTPATRQGFGAGITLSECFKFDAKTCPMSLHHGGVDLYTPNGSTLIYRELRKHKVPAELHLYPNIGHKAMGLERAVEFMTQMGFMGQLQPEVSIMERYASDDAIKDKVVQDVWPEDQMPDAQNHQCKPYIEWHFPKEVKTDAIQIIYSGGSYEGNNPDGFEVAPARRYLNELGMTVVTMKYRTPRPKNLPKHITAWQDLQRAIKLVRSQAAHYGLNPDKIGIMGSSAGGHLTLMGVTSSMQHAYWPVDEIDNLSCHVQWGIGIYPAYALTDGAEENNTTGGNENSAVLVPEFNFDLKTAPMLFIHGDADGWAAMNSVKTWEKMRAMGIQSELHTLALRNHCFQHSASPGTGSYTWLERIGDFLRGQGILSE